MSDFDSLREGLDAALAAIQHNGDATTRAWTANVDDHTALWCDIGEVRDEIHAVANRLEALTAFVTSNPAEVAAKIVNDANRETLVEVDKHGKPLTPFAIALRKQSQEAKRRPADEVTDAD